MLFHLYQFSFCGYRSGRNFITIDDNEIMLIESFAKRLPSILKDLLSTHNDADALVTRLLEFFFGIYAVHTEEFAFPPGDRKLLVSISVFIHTNFEKDPQFFATSENLIKCPVEPTPIGNLYSTITSKVKKTVDFTDKLDTVSLTLLVDNMKKCLSQKLKHSLKTIAKEFPIINEYVKLDKVHLRSESVSSMLKSFTDVSMKTTLAVGTIECSCSGKATSISFHFRLQDKITETVAKILQKRDISSEEMDKMKTCWIISNLMKHHKKIHMKSQKTIGNF